ncbi:BlaI/MecI/CopY family transcriptional regulator [Paraliomyxa miuraensis]|uniref:BlaI/MecI/CopY family transcriptional regulator n=1 Tax=Paraliomyxa miuraensis TaxID=376150 RepID=UPI00224E5845|nr:BlaI/MecI/CopY family transcriptional regulator [Paraliomyxa miuraensis]MCX4244291.1 BlaI/MecI/CopY family transcriptional regulator [Paraliomyxa miuraensis]
MTTAHLGKLQLAIMRVLWADGESTVAEVHRSLEPSHGLAPTTIATMLKKMEAKGVVAHHTEGRRFIYRATLSEDAVTRSMVADLKERLFDGSAVALVSHLLQSHEVDDDELAALRQQIERAQDDADRSGGER